jgi:SAM-dependent methyltransferase
MDLRALPLGDSELTQIKALITAGKVVYQPFLFRDDLEVGEGLAFATNTSDTWPPRKEVIYWPDHPDSLQALAVREENLVAFRQANAQLRGWYEDNVRAIVGLVDRIEGHDFLDFGCNAGYTLHRLSALGARRAIGVDAGDFFDVFTWFNQVTGGAAEFIRGEWDSAGHLVRGAELPEVDVAITVSVTCHVADPLHLLAYLCRLARRAVFFMTPLSGKTDVSLTFGHPPNYFDERRRWPGSFDSQVLPSAALVELGLRQCGFGDISRPKDNVFVAYRTGRGGSMFDIPPQADDRVPALIEEGYCGAFNIIRCGDRYFALAQDEGAFSIERVQRGSYRRCLAAPTIERLKLQLQAWLQSSADSLAR